MLRLFVLAATLFATGTLGQEDFVMNPCSFYYMWQMYRSCAMDVLFTRPLIENMETVTADDILEELEVLCENRTIVEDCLTSSLGVCDKVTGAAVMAAYERSFAICDGNQGLKDSVRQVFEAERKAPSQQTTKANCFVGFSGNDCASEIIRRLGLDSNEFYRMTAQEAQEEDRYFTYFRDLFQCTKNSIAVNCPDNAVTMTVAFRSFMFIPPQLSIDIASILLSGTSSTDVDDAV